jgi:mono/diheme cytochrome c family protein
VRTVSSSTCCRLGLLLWILALCPASPQGQGQDPAIAGALPAVYTGRDIFELACSTCHGPDGTGSPRSVVGFDAELPDFTDCQFATPEPFGDWFAVVHNGGPVRGLGRQMPAFGEALSDEDIEAVIRYLWTFCDNPAWPRGDLNLPRTFFIEKAFPENEAIFTTAMTTRGPRSVGSELVYERRFGIRNQLELAVPVDVQQNADAGWSRGLGDVAVAFKRTLYSSLETGRIFSVGAEMVVPTGKESGGFGHGFTIYEPSAMFGQILPRGMFLQAQAGIEVPSDHRRGNNETFWRAAFGTTLAQDAGFGRAWSPAVEVLGARETDGIAEWDIVPQMQVTLSKLQHVMVAGGLRIPVNAREERHPQVLTYLIWDWFDGSFFDFWR